jgi:HEAT repeat protein
VLDALEADEPDPVPSLPTATPDLSYNRESQMRTRVHLLCCLLLASAALAAKDAPHLGKTLAQWQSDLASTDRLDRLIAARSIGEMAIANQPAAAKAIFAAISHDDSAVRYWAVVAAGQMGSRAKPATRLLQGALSDDAPEVQAWAAFALVKLGREGDAIPVLAKLLDHPDRAARLQAIHALGALGPAAAGATEAVKQVLDDEFDYVQRVARHTLWTLGERPCPYRECQ